MKMNRKLYYCNILEIRVTDQVAVMLSRSLISLNLVGSIIILKFILLHVVAVKNYKFFLFLSVSQPFILFTFRLD